MSEDRDRLTSNENDEPGTELEDVEAHQLKSNATDEGTDDGDDVEAHRLKGGQ